MGEGDGVSSLNDLNEKYKQWVKNQKIEGGTTGTCNADSLYTPTSISEATDSDSKRINDYYVCGSTDGGKCVGLSFEEWDDIWGNCQSKAGNVNYNKDRCINMAVQTTPGVSEFDMGLEAGPEDVYDPVTNSGCNGCTLSDRQKADPDNYEALGDTLPYNSGMDTRVLFSTDGENHGLYEDNCDECRIGGVEGMRPAFPNTKTDKLKTIGETDGDLVETKQCPYGDILSRQLYCTLDGHEAIGDDGRGCGMGSDEPPEDLARFCARRKSDYDDTNIANCCLGSLAGGPEVDTEGNPISASYKSCPREFCVSRIAEGTESGSAGVNCDNPKTDKNASNVDETFCYKMSNECNTFFTEKCQDAFSDDYSGNLKQQCKDWAHIQPQEFVRIAEDVCNINSPTNDYVDERARPTSTDLRHVKSVLNRPLCREYITSTEHYPTESQKLKNLCKHYMKEQDDGSWEAQESLDHDNVLENICGCHYPSGYYTWYNRRYETREAGTCEDSEGNALSAISRSECESGTPPGTWTPDAGAASITAALSDMMKPYPQCYYDKCISSMLYDVHNDAIPCSGNLQLCYQQMTQNNVMVGQDGNLSELPDMSALTGRAQQTCNQSTLSSPPPPSSDVGGDNDDSGGFLSGIFGGSDDGTVSDGSDSDNTNMIILIVVILLIVIIGVVVVVVLNKGKSTPQEMVVQQPLAA